VIVGKPGQRYRELEVFEVGPRHVFFWRANEPESLVLLHRTGEQLEEVCDESWAPLEMYEARES
jgi:hypothetical protein